MANGKITLGKQSGGTLWLVFPDGVSNTEVVLPESGNVVSVGTAVTDNAIARYDGTTGKLQNSGVFIDDSGNVGVGTSNPIYKIHMVGAPSYNGILRIEAGGTTTTDAVLDLTARGSNGVYNNAEIIAVGSTNNGTTLVFSTDNPAGNITRQMNLDSIGNLLLTSGTGALGYGAGAGGTVTQLTSKSTAVTLNKPCGVIITHNAALAAGAMISFTFNNSLIEVDDILILKIGTAGSRYSIDANISTGGSAGINITNRTAVSYSDSLAISFAIVRGSNA